MALFNKTEKMSDDISGFKKWNSMLDRYSNREHDFDFYESWQKIINKTKKVRSNLNKIKRINKFVNRNIIYVKDIINFDEKDYWASPIEIIEKGKGDCEDFAILKYYLLKEVGLNLKLMRIVVLTDNDINEKHAILAVYDDEKIYILDNQMTMVYSHEKLSHYDPIYSINESAWWRHT